jgi:hypothetical protein
MGTTEEGHDVEPVKRAAAWLVWILVVAVAIVALLGLLLLGPFGLAVGIPVAILAFVVIGAVSSGPAAGA